jgi:hypothetical protein
MSERNTFTNADSKGNGSVQGARACLLVPKRGSTFYKICGKNFNAIIKKIRDLKLSLKDNPSDDDLRALLFDTTPGRKAIKDTDTEYYFYFPPPNKQNRNLLVALQNKLNGINQDTIDDGSSPTITSFLGQILGFLHTYYQPIIGLIMFCIVAYFLLLEDDTKSYVPKKTHTWLSTTTTAKKFADIGSYWHKHFGEGQKEVGEYDPNGQDKLPMMLRPGFTAIPYGNNDDEFQALKFTD